METIALFFEKGGIFMYFNVFLATIALAIVIERGIFMFLSMSVTGTTLLETVRKLLLSRQLDRAIRMTAGSTGPIQRVAHVALIRATQGEEAVASAVEETLVELTPTIKKRISALWALANIATLMGLIGTISGLITSFAAVASGDPEERSSKLSAGISEAMNNTWLGLMIAVCCIGAHLVLSGMAKKRVSEMELFAIKIQNMLGMESVKACLTGPQASSEEGSK